MVSLKYIVLNTRIANYLVVGRNYDVLSVIEIIKEKHNLHYTHLEIVDTREEKNIHTLILSITEELSIYEDPEQFPDRGTYELFLFKMQQFKGRPLELKSVEIDVVGKVIRNSDNYAIVKLPVPQQANHGSGPTLPSVYVFLDKKTMKVYPYYNGSIKSDIEINDKKYKYCEVWRPVYWKYTDTVDIRCWSYNKKKIMSVEEASQNGIFERLSTTL